MSDILNYIGKTPLIQISPKLFAKLETYNPTGSIKDRMAYYVLTKAEERGELKPGDTIVEASSGNTGISFSMLGSVKGYKVIIILPCNMSEERKQMIRLFGATIIEVDKSDFEGAIALRDKMVEENENYFSPNQFANPDNIDCHMWTTGMEIKQELIRRGEEKIAAIVYEKSHGEVCRLLDTQVYNGNACRGEGPWHTGDWGWRRLPC